MNQPFKPPTVETERQPPDGGYDKPCDVAEAKRQLPDLVVGLNGSEFDSNIYSGMAQLLFKLGISLNLAGHLAAECSGGSLEADEVQSRLYEYYELSFDLGEQPGSESIETGDALDWPEAEVIDDFEGPKPYERIWPFPLEYDHKMNAAQHAEIFVNNRPSRIIFASGDFYTLEGNRIWRELSEDALAAEVRLTDPKNNLDVDRILKMIKAIRMARFSIALPFDWIAEPRDAPAASDLLLFANGILDSSTKTLIPHAGRLFVTALPEYDFDPAAQCPEWQKRLGQWIDPSFHPTLQEFMGYMLTSSTAYEVLLVMIGPPRSGKGTVTHIMQQLVGSELFVSRTLNDLGGDFGLEGSNDKRFIFVPDAADADPRKRNVVIERIKSIVGNDVVGVNRKHKKNINAKIAAKIVMVCNRHPKLLDDSTALAARELAITFKNSFLGKEDRDLRAKLECELPGIANWALEGLDRLRRNGRFTVGALGIEAVKDFANQQSPVLRFAEAHLIVTGNPDDFEKLEVVFERYAQWADYEEQLQGGERRNRDDFKSDLVSALGARGVVHTQRRWHDPTKPRWKRHDNGKPRRGLYGLKLTPAIPLDDAEA
jgi:P4 family phage/plasmid primase-like protien